MVVLLDEPGNLLYGKQRLALTHSKRRPAGSKLLGFLQRTEHTLTRAGGHEHLLALGQRPLRVWGSLTVLTRGTTPRRGSPFVARYSSDQYQTMQICLLSTPDHVPLLCLEL